MAAGELWMGFAAVVGGGAGLLGSYSKFMVFVRFIS